MDKFTVRKVETGIKFDLKAANGQTVLTSEVYKTEAACQRGIASVRKNAPTAPVEDRTAETCRVLPNPKYEVYQDKSGAYRFRLRARNGQIIGISEGYERKAGCLGGIESVRINASEE